MTTSTKPRSAKKPAAASKTEPQTSLRGTRPGFPRKVVGPEDADIRSRCSDLSIHLGGRLEGIIRDEVTYTLIYQAQANDDVLEAALKAGLEAYAAKVEKLRAAFVRKHGLQELDRVLQGYLRLVLHSVPADDPLHKLDYIEQKLEAVRELIEDGKIVPGKPRVEEAPTPVVTSSRPGYRRRGERREPRNKVSPLNPVHVAPGALGTNCTKNVDIRAEDPGALTYRPKAKK